MTIAGTTVHEIIRLDNLYKMTSHVYGDRNSVRSKEATFAHFVEVCGMLTIHERKKKREGFDLTDALCKALGWYFPLLSKMRVRSVEELVFRKFPTVCPYCRKAPHQEAECKLVLGTGPTVDHDAVVAIYDREFPNRPATLDEWQMMFSRIYPRSVNEGSRSTVALMEELGELAEAVRVFDVHPQYFLGEAADTFSYIMGIATEHSMREQQEGRTFSFEREYLTRYPGLCRQCGSRICICPAIPAATIGRMAKELDIRGIETVFISDLKGFVDECKQAAENVFDNLGGYTGLTNTLPFDRGDANHALVQICLKVAGAIEGSNPALAATLHAEAIKIGELQAEAGTNGSTLDVGSLIETLQAELKALSEDKLQEIKGSVGLVGDIVDILDTTRVLFVISDSSATLRLAEEQRVVSLAVGDGHAKRRISVEFLHAARVDELQNKLLYKDYDVLHFSGHSDGLNLYFNKDASTPLAVPLAAVRTLVNSHPSIKCVILNACESVLSFTDPISEITIGMDKTVDDRVAILFSSGLYQAMAAGKTIQQAFAAGKTSVELSSMSSDLIKIIER